MKEPKNAEQSRHSRHRTIKLLKALDNETVINIEKVNNQNLENEVTRE